MYVSVSSVLIQIMYSSSVEKKNSVMDNSIFERDPENTITNISELNALNMFILPQISEIVFNYVFNHKKFNGRLCYSQSIEHMNLFDGANARQIEAIHVEKNSINILCCKKIVDCRGYNTFAQFEIITPSNDQSIKIDYECEALNYIEPKIHDSQIFFCKMGKKGGDLCFFVYDLKNGDFIRTFNTISIDTGASMCRFFVISDNMVGVFRPYVVIEMLEIHNTYELNGKAAHRFNVPRDSRQPFFYNVEYCDGKIFICDEHCKYINVFNIFESADHAVLLNDIQWNKTIHNMHNHLCITGFPPIFSAYNNNMFIIRDPHAHIKKLTSIKIFSLDSISIQNASLIGDRLPSVLVNKIMIDRGQICIFYEDRVTIYR